jgi:hypothetical protein
MISPVEPTRAATPDGHGEAGATGRRRPAVTTTPQRPPRSTWAPGLLAVILLGALALRIYGVRWALPERTDLNPDEHTVLGIVASMSWQNLDPGAYFYGGLFYEVCVLVRSILRVLWPGIGDAGLVLAYRRVSALFGTATVAVHYGLLRRVAPAGRRLCWAPPSSRSCRSTSGTVTSRSLTSC